MVTEDETEERARYLRIGQAIEAALSRLEQQPRRKPSRQGTHPLTEEQAVRGARQLIKDAEEAEGLKDWLPTFWERVEAWAHAEDAKAVYQRVDPEYPINSLYKTVYTRCDELWEECADLVWPQSERRPMPQRLEALQDLTSLYRMAAGQSEEVN